MTFTFTLTAIIIFILAGISALYALQSTIRTFKDSIRESTFLVIILMLLLIFSIGATIECIDTLINYESLEAESEAENKVNLTLRLKKEIKENKKLLQDMGEKK